jgi:integration host factor subunit beta
VTTVTKKELTDRIADKMKLKRSLAKDVIQTFLDEMVRDLSKGNRLEFRDFGVFEVRIRKPRMAQNPRTLERVPVPTKGTVKFKVGRVLKDAIQKVALQGRKGERSAAPTAASQPTPPPA